MHQLPNINVDWFLFGSYLIAEKSICADKPNSKYCIGKEVSKKIISSFGVNLSFVYLKNRSKKVSSCNSSFMFAIFSAGEVLNLLLESFLFISLLVLVATIERWYGTDLSLLWMFLKSVVTIAPEWRCELMKVKSRLVCNFIFSRKDPLFCLG